MSHHALGFLLLLTRIVNQAAISGFLKIVASEMALWVKVLGHKPDDPTLISVTKMVEGEG